MDRYEKDKETEGKFAAIVWLLSGVYLFWTSEKASFLTWQAAVYFIVGMFVAATVFGIAFYLVQRGTTKVLTAMFHSPSTGVATVIASIGFVLMVVETIVIFVVAQWVVENILF